MNFKALAPGPRLQSVAWTASLTASTLDVNRWDRPGRSRTKVISTRQELLRPVAVDIDLRGAFQGKLIFYLAP